MIVAITGHRPNRLWGYDLSHPHYQALKEEFQSFLKQNLCEEVITGMALGIDTLFAQAVLELKEEGYPIRLHCAIPCKNQSSKWPTSSTLLYQSILAKADKIIFVSQDNYTNQCMQIRNQYMVDHADLLYAVWNGSNSGTGNCVQYAISQNKSVYQVNPIQFIKGECVC